ncbi:hypothetical protein AWB80_08157 [Caballeronia pedi]|uniref:Morphogenetic protein n=1 Tax=Caballeronia pedi TaxID=1777141 RepID=A0A158E569_9BURK|nr:hypothetical protein [Caballeronia pedi]SAL01576.1 hypothetical protein AWB80_08157 [Caballeronia pedi]
MKETPILFSSEMVHAILSGKKTQTRRMVVPGRGYQSTWLDVETINSSPRLYTCHTNPDRRFGAQMEHPRGGPLGWVASPFGQPGDRLWVRETWQHSNHPLGPFDEDCTVFYRADYLDDPHGPDGEKSPEGKYRTWRPPIHMPRAAARITLDITAIRVERLQDIDDADALDEGASYRPAPNELSHGGWTHDGWYVHDSARESFRTLWNGLNAARGCGWDVNPWVWVIEFARKTA